MQAQHKKYLLQLFCKMAMQKNGFGSKSCANDKQACVFCVFEFKNYSVPNLITINGKAGNLVIYGPKTLQNQVLHGTLLYDREHTCS